MKETRRIGGKIFRLKHEVTISHSGWADKQAKKLRKQGYQVRIIRNRTRLTGVTDLAVYIRKKKKRGR